MKQCKVIVTGAFNAGKTEFVRQASEIEIVTTERRITDPQTAGVKEETTVAMDYGQARINKVLVHLYGTPGQSRFEFMWDILSREMDAFVLLVDSTDQASFMDAIQLIRLLRKKGKTPYLVAANKQDLPAALPPDEIKQLLGLTDSVPVVPCVAPDVKSVQAVLRAVLEILD